MRLRPKLIIMFVSTLVLINGFIIFLFPPMAERVTMTQLFSLARTVGFYFVHNLEGLPYNGEEAAFERAVSAQFDFVSTLAEKTQEFTVRKIILVRPDMRVEAVAKPGQILVSEELAREPGIADLFVFQGTGEINAKGKSLPIKVRGLRGLKQGA